MQIIYREDLCVEIKETATNILHGLACMKGYDKGIDKEKLERILRKLQQVEINGIQAHLEATKI